MCFCGAALELPLIRLNLSCLTDRYITHSKLGRRIGFWTKNGAALLRRFEAGTGIRRVDV